MPSASHWRPSRFWREETACSKAPDPSLWVGADGKHYTPRKQLAAKAICWGVCPVRLDCLWVALQTRTGKGIYGGLNEDELKELRAKFPGDANMATLSTVGEEKRYATPAK